MIDLKKNLHQIQTAISQAAKECQRNPDEILLLAVSKTQPFAAIKKLHELGVNDFAENYVQEAVRKISQAQNLAITWHFIGSIQSNKTKLIAENFSWVHSISDIRHAERLNMQRPAHLPKLNVCIQININAEKSKSGLAPAEVKELAEKISQLSNLNLRGIMILPQQTEDEILLRQQFKQAKNIFDDLNKIGFALDTLSMGMSQDFAWAIAEGATIVRIGTAIFGAR